MDKRSRLLVVPAALFGLAGCANGVLVAVPTQEAVNPASAASVSASTAFVEHRLPATSDGSRGDMRAGSAMAMDHGAGMSHTAAKDTPAMQHEMQATRSAETDSNAHHGSGSVPASQPQQGAHANSATSSMGGHGGQEGHGSHGAAGGDRGHAEHASGAGRPGDPKRVTRTVNVTALDMMRFQPSTIRVQAGETIRFVVTNAGKVEHEFVLATPEEQQEHEAMMAKMPGMKHEEEPNAITLAPGATKSLIWRFDKPGNVQAGCHVPGHFPAGMVATIAVEPARPGQSAPK